MGVLRRKNGLQQRKKSEVAKPAEINTSKDTNNSLRAVNILHFLNAVVILK